MGIGFDKRLYLSGKIAYDVFLGIQGHMNVFFVVRDPPQSPGVPGLPLDDFQLQDYYIS
ncbi:MAG: hypothetical protein K0Q90_1678 [Paenibacillaceae bacterium]|nr:hypothetical protein [Paenibacillaceae bacterium]